MKNNRYSLESLLSTDWIQAEASGSRVTWCRRRQCRRRPRSAAAEASSSTRTPRRPLLACRCDVSHFLFLQGKIHFIKKNNNNNTHRPNSFEDVLGSMFGFDVLRCSFVWFRIRRTILAKFLGPQNEILSIKRSRTGVAKLFGPRAIYRNLDEGAGHTT